ncbi:MAG: anti-sigma factor [Phycisphaerales bacterium]|nr:anti-sigma factor [Phycisphaerales bacterium]
MNRHSAEERLLQLLADRATEGLDTEAVKELDDLLASHAHYDEFHLDSAAAAVDLAMSPPVDAAMPGPLRDRIVTDAERFFTTLDGGQSESRDRPVTATKTDRVAYQRGGRLGWYAAAASLVLAVLGWWQVLSTQSPSSIPVARQYNDFLRDTPDLVRAPWTGKEPDYESVSGEVVWSDSNQRGFMRLVGLPPNDPKSAQYQLWIVDPMRDKNPIDGGVFDVSTKQEVIIPIDAKLRVDRPTVFAITREKPGGVVVSGGPLLVVGSVQG